MARGKKTSGKSVRDSISVQIRSLEQDHEQHSRGLYDVQAQITTLTDQREETISQLARFYLPTLEAQAVQATGKDLQGKVKRFFQEKQERRKKLDQSLLLSKEKSNALQEQITAIDDNLEQIVDRTKEVQRTIAEELNGNVDYVALHIQARQSQSRLDQNKKRAEVFGAEAAQKLRAYEGEKEFMYLVRRNFSTARYTESGLAQRLDTWVAKIVNYRENKANYSFLKSMPSAIQEEINRQQEELDPLVQKIERTEGEVRQKYKLPVILKEGEDLLQRKRIVTGNFAKEEKEFQKYAQERKDLDSKKDEYHRAALDELKSYLKGDDITDLKRRARDTPHSQDDRLVDQIETIDIRIKTLKAQAKRLQEKQTEITGSLEGLQTISRRYSSKDYAASRSYFGDDLEIDTLLTGYIAGKITADAFNTELDQHHHWKPKETYSSYDTGGYTPSYRSPDREPRDNNDSYTSIFSSGGDTSGGGWSGGGDIGGGGGGWSSGGDI